MYGNFKSLKKEQLKYFTKIEKLAAVIDDMAQSNVDLLSEVISATSYRADADGLMVQLKNPNISISVVAEVSQGKSTFLNTLIFRDQVLDSGAGAVTARLFKLDYGDKYSISIDGNTKFYTSIDKLKEAVKGENQKIRNIVDQKNSLNKEIFEVDITIPHPSLKEGITIYDTPGFGSLDESIVYPLIQAAVSKSDAVVMLIDISQGLKRTENEFVKNVLKAIPSNKRFVVFNKLDSVISEDQVIILTKEEIEKQLEKVKQDTLKSLAKVSGIPENEIIFYILSSSKALAGFKMNDQKKIEESKFDEFENDFWKRVVDNKMEVFEDRIKNSRELISRCENQVSQVKLKFQQNLDQLEKLQKSLIQNRAEFSAFAKQSIKSLNEEIKRFTNDLSTLFDIDSLMSNIAEIVENSIYDNLDEIDWIDKMKLWSLKDKYISQIEKAIEDSESLISEAVQDYILSVHNKLYESQLNINEKIDRINEKINSFEDLGVEPLEYIEILKQNPDGSIDLQAGSDYSDFISVDKEVFILVAGIIAEIIAVRIAVMIPGIGLIVSTVLYAIAKMYKNYKDPNKELAAKVTEAFISELENGLAAKLDEIKASSNEIKNAMTTALLAGRTRIEMIQNSFENPEEKQKEIENILEELNDIEKYYQEIANLKD